MTTTTTVAATIATATIIGPSDYIVSAPSITVGLRFAVNGKMYEVVGEPIMAGWCAYWARTREIGGPFDGNEFAAYLRLR